jgi:hypothetical protein
MNDIDNWTEQDTDDFVSLLNWRARLFFNAREKVEKRLAIFQQMYDDTGKQPSSCSHDDIQKMLQPYAPSWIEKAIVTPNFFNAIAGFIIITIAILYLNP